MSTELAFSVFGAGYKGFSAGTAFLALKVNGSKMLYKSTLCEGMSSSIAYSAKPFTIDHHRVLLCLQGLPVKIEIKRSFINPFGDVAEFNLEIYNPNKSDPIYKTSRKPLVGGFSAGGVDILTRYKYIDIAPQMNAYGNMIEYNAPKWDEVWNAQLR